MIQEVLSTSILPTVGAGTVLRPNPVTRYFFSMTEA